MKKIVLLALCVAAISAVSCKSEAEKKAEELKQQGEAAAAAWQDQANKTAAEYGF